MPAQQIVTNQNSLSLAGGNAPDRGEVLVGPFTPGFITLQITDVVPANPVEHSPISIAFSLSNIQNVPLHGRVESASGGVTTIADLAPGATFSGTVSSTAPSAGPNMPLPIYYFDAAAQGEFPQPDASDFTAVDVAATYVLTVDSLTVDKRCSALEDDVVAGSVAAKFGDTPLDNPADPFDHSGTRPVSLGKVPPGAPRALGIEFAKFKMLPGSPPLSISYAFTANTGEEVVKAIMNLLSAGSSTLLTILYPQASSAWKAIDDAVKSLHDLVFGDCGRPVAVDSFAAPNDLLLALTAAKGVYTQLKTYKIQPSRGWPCQDSQYTLTLTIKRTSFKL